MDALNRSLARAQLDIARYQQVVFFHAASDAAAAGNEEAAQEWDRLALDTMRRMRELSVQLYGVVHERLEERVVSVRVLDVAKRKRCKVALRAMASVERERVGL